jgi:DNA modification methylase
MQTAPPVEVECAHTELRPIGTLKPHPKNPKQHPKSQIELLARIIKRQGWRAPIVVSKRSGFIVAGHGKHAAAQLLGLADVPVDVQDFDSEDAELAHLLADNRVGELADIDEAIIAEVVASISDGFDTDLTGYDEVELSRIVDATLDVKEDAVPEPPAEPITKPGDLWSLGEHRLICGDATKTDDVARLMNGAKADACVTDPPYNINYGNIKHPKFKQREIENDNMSSSDFKSFCDKFVSSIATHCAGCVYCFGPPGPDGRIMFTALDNQLHCSTTIIWNKDQFTLGRGKYQNKYEPCWFGWVEDGSRFQDDRTRTNVWNFDRPKASEEHPTMKPVALISECISHSTTRGATVFDPFLGSGTTLIAAEQLSRKCYGMEISPAYCDVIVKRWETLTGKKATREQA